MFFLLLYIPSTLEKKPNSTKTSFTLSIINPYAKTENPFFDFKINSVINDSVFKKVTIDPLDVQKMTVFHEKKEVRKEENKKSLIRFTEKVEVKPEPGAHLENLLTEFKVMVNKPSKTNKKKLEMEFLETNEKKEYFLQVYLGLYEPGKSPIGNGSLKYLFDSKNGLYYIKLVAEAAGWAKLFIQQPIVYESRGVLNSNGLTSEYYRLDSPKRGKETATVNYKEQTIFFSSTNASPLYFHTLP